MKSLLIILLLSLLGALGDVFLKFSGAQARVHIGWLIAGSTAYLLTIPGWFFVMRYVPLAAVGALYATCTAVILVLLGVFWFHERLTPSELAGFALSIVVVVALRRLL